VPPINVLDIDIDVKFYSVTHRVTDWLAMSGYIDHADCLADVQESSDGRQLDCFHIYPQVLPLAADWKMSGQEAHGQKYKTAPSTMTPHELIYWGWTMHLYVF